MLVDSQTQWQTIKVNRWYGEGERQVEVFTGTAVWYHTGKPNDYQRALNTLRYIHANPKAAQMKKGFFYDFSNYGTHDRLTDDGITQWHPAFLSEG